MSRAFYGVFGIATGLLLAAPFLKAGPADWSYLLRNPHELAILLIPLALVIAVPIAVHALTRQDGRGLFDSSRGTDIVGELRKVRRGKPSETETLERLKALPRRVARPAAYHRPEKPPAPLAPEASARLHVALFAGAAALSTAVGLLLTRGAFEWLLVPGILVLTLGLYLPSALLLRRPWRASPCARGITAPEKVHPIRESVLDTGKQFPFLNRRWG